MLPKAQCISCGRTDQERPLQKLPGSLSNHLACAPCISRHGNPGLENEADRLLTVLKEFVKPVCLACGSPTVALTPEGHTPLVCTSCERKKQEYFNARHRA